MDLEKRRKRHREYMREYYKTHTAQMKEANQRCEYNRLQRFRKRIYDYQIMMGGCELCPAQPTPQQNLDFHHIDPSTKLFGLADGYKHSWEEALIEIGKCMILCPSCHLKREPRRKRK